MNAAKKTKDKDKHLEEQKLRTSKICNRVVCEKTKTNLYLLLDDNNSKSINGNAL